MGGIRRRQRVAIASLSALGAADAAYMLAYHEGWIDSLACPFFGDGCARVGRSAHARHLGVPNAAVGLAGYAGMGAMAIAAGRGGAIRRRWLTRGLAVVAGAAVAASAFLTWEQAARVRAWCFWCLTSAGVNVAIFSLVSRYGTCTGRRRR